MENSAVFEVVFYKTLLDSNGHPHRARQGLVHVAKADTPEAASDIAKATFAQERHILHWEYCADEVMVEEESG